MARKQSISLYDAYALLEPRALAAMGAGEERISMQALAEDARRNSFAMINNDHLAPIADMLIERHPELKPLIERRKRNQPRNLAPAAQLAAIDWISQLIAGGTTKGFVVDSLVFRTPDGHRLSVHITRTQS